MIDERAYLRRLSSAAPDELRDLISHAGPDEERVLRIYLGPEQLDKIRATLSQSSQLRGEQPPKLGNAVILHGIMGGELSLFTGGSQDSVWINVLRLLQGRFDWLGLDENTGASIRDVRATGMYMRFYARQIVSLNTQWNVRSFFYDWRRDVRIAADDLLSSINSWFGPDAPVHLVAHSMGGLVARSFIARHSERWRAMWDPNGGKSGGRLVMLGTPNYGSFAIPRLLFGTNDVIDTLSRIDLPHLFDKNFLLNFIKTFVGAYQMLPVRGKLTGLEALYNAATYTRASVLQKHLDNAESFQREITGVVNPDRMVYIAGYNRNTACGIANAAQLGNDSGYLFTRRGDGTVPHSLGLLDGVKTFYVDEEHGKLPQNDRVLRALTEVMTTGALQNQDNLWFGLDGSVRGAEVESQTALQQSEAERRARKQKQADLLRLSLESRGSVTSDAVTPEEQAVIDLLLGHTPPDSAVPSAVGDGEASPVSSQKPLIRQTPTQITPTEIRVNVVLANIQDVGPNITGDPLPVDCTAVGHYYGVRPSGSELGLDRVVSAYFRGTVKADQAVALKTFAAGSGGFVGDLNSEDSTATAPENGSSSDGTSEVNHDLLLTQFHDRGILRGELGEPFFLPDPRPDRLKSLIAIAGMGRTGTFGVPELTVLARELTWSVAQLGKEHLATVLAGEGSNNLSVPDAVHGWLLGLNLALTSAANGGSRALKSITFVVRDEKKLAAIATAVRREAKDLESRLNFHLDLSGVPLPAKNVTDTRTRTAATRIAVEFVEGAYKFSALTGEASIPERIEVVNPKRITDINNELMQEPDPDKQMRLGSFLTTYLFPRDLRTQLTGSAPIVLQLNNAAAQVHWEMAALPLEEQDQLGMEDREFLGLVRGLTRQLRTNLAPPPEPPPPVTRVLRVLIVADTCKEHPLPGAQVEGKELTALFDRFNQSMKDANRPSRIEYTALLGPASATTLRVLMEINGQPPYDVLHYAGHCFYNQDKPENSGYLFSDGDILTANDLQRIDRTPKFVFSNACESGVLPSRLDRHSPALAPSFAEAFFAKGVANFVCTAWPINDQAALKFALTLYSYLLGAEPATEPKEMAAAMREARKSIANTTGSLTWGAYQHYGSPSFRLLRPIAPVK